MARVVVAATASADQAAILGYLHAKAGARTVTKFRSLFSALYDRLAAYPASGPRRPRLGAGIRIGIVSPYIVIYRYTPEDDTVTVLRVVHGKRKITGKLLAGTP